MITTAAWVIVLAAGGLASGSTVALAITVPALALGVAVAAAIAAAARYPRVRPAWRTSWPRRSRRARGCCAGRPPTRNWPSGPGPSGSAHAVSPTSNWALASGDALLNWFADAAVLAVGIIAVGAAVPWHDLLLVYAAGIGAQGLSLTPGGLAITEGAISVALVASGVHVRQAVAAAVLYRLISFWFDRRARVADPAVPAGPQARGVRRAGTRA